MKLTFTSLTDSTINVVCKVSSIDVEVLDKPFKITDISGIRSKKDIKLFYFITKGLSYTLNEFIFISGSKNLVLKVKTDNDDLVATF